MYENRRFERIPRHLAIKYHIITLGASTAKQVSASAPSQSENISAGGLLFVTKEMLPLGTFLELELNYRDSDGQSQLLFLKARVVRLEELPSGLFDIGISFSTLTDSDRQALQKYILNPA